MRADLFEDSTLGAPTPQPKAPHDFRLRTIVAQRDENGDRFNRLRGYFCIKCGVRQNESEFCTNLNSAPGSGR
jgi:hypothetical protein